MDDDVLARLDELEDLMEWADNHLTEVYSIYGNEKLPGIDLEIIGYQLSWEYKEELARSRRYEGTFSECLVKAMTLGDSDNE